MKRREVFDGWTFPDWQAWKDKSDEPFSSVRHSQVFTEKRHVRYYDEKRGFVRPKNPIRVRLIIEEI